MKSAIGAIAAFAAAFFLTLGFSEVADAEPLHVASALVTAETRDDGIMWHARWIVTPEDADSVRGGEILFARPLEPGERLEVTPDVREIVQAGRVIGVSVQPSAMRGRTIEGACFQPLAKLDAEIPLGLPVAQGSTVQIVYADLGGGSWIEVAPRHDFIRHVGYVAPKGVSAGAREEARRLTRWDVGVSDQPIYLRGTDLSQTATGLHGKVSSVQERSRGSYVAIGLLFATAVVGLALAARKLRTQALEERADAILASEIERAATPRRKTA